MPDGIDVISDLDKLGILDKDLENVFLNDTVKDIIANFAQRIQGKLKDSIDKNKLNYTSELFQSLAVTPNIIETDEFIFYKLDIPRHGVYQNEGVSGTKKKYNGSRFSFKESSKPPFGAMVKWAETKFGLNVPADQRKAFGFAAAYNKKYFGIKPTFWIDDVLTDKVFEDLQNELGKRVGIFINEQF